MKGRAAALLDLEWGPGIEAMRALMGIRMEMDRKRAWRVRQLEFPDMRIGFVRCDKLKDGFYAWGVVGERYVASHKYFPTPNSAIGLAKQPAGVHWCKKLYIQYLCRA